jgi:hypothetical protein
VGKKQGWEISSSRSLLNRKVGTGGRNDGDDDLG